ncbi:MAG: hypothetical protein JNJ75_10565 [Cyclobacteriaceae bacterium]|nr:hypothetical protein [Cyclobacteriaceae bacterium]
MYTLTGKIVVRETLKGIPNLIVRALDLDLPASDLKVNSQAPDLTLDQKLPFDSIGSVLTDRDGSFVLTFDQSDFTATAAEIAPDIMLIIEAPEDVSVDGRQQSSTVLYQSKSIRLKAGKNEAFYIRFAESILKEKGLADPFGEVNYLELERSLNKQVFGELASAGSKIKKRVANVFENFRSSSTFALDQTYNSLRNDHQKVIELQNHLFDSYIKKINSSDQQDTIMLRLSTEKRKSIQLTDESSASFPGSLLEDLIGAPAAITSSINCLPIATEEAIFSSPTVINSPKETPTVSEAPEISKKDIMAKISQLMGSVTSPETQLHYSGSMTEASEQLKTICTSLNALAICGGPADITSYHDFKTIQLAFDHIWTEAFDNSTVALGKKLYEEIVKVEEGYTSIIKSSTTVGYPVAPQGFAQPLSGINTSSSIQPTPGVQVVNGNAMPAWTLPDRINTVSDLRDFVKQFTSHSVSIPDHIQKLVDQLDQKLSEPHGFQVFAPNSINYGLLYTFRQKWEPASYQVGRLISSVPLAPKEIRKYTTKVVSVMTKNQKRLDDQELKSHYDSSITSRAEAEIINKAQNKTSFSLNAGASYSAGVVSADVKTQLGTEAENLSSESKKNFRESVIKASRDFFQKNKVEVELSGKNEIENTTSGEIINPNDEIPVTYLLYELQRQYDISEELYRIDPVIFVANEVPMPDEITLAWLTSNAWILRKVILDPMYLEGLYSLNDNALGGTIALGLLRDNLNRQAALVQVLTTNLSRKDDQVQHSFDTLIKIINKDPSLRQLNADESKHAANMLSSVLNPIGSLINSVMAEAQDEERLKRLKEATNMSMERQERERAEVNERLSQEFNQLQTLTNQYVDELKKVLDREHSITQLRIHVKQNILYYMQAIWDHEPTDQRFFRLANLEIDWFEPLDEITLTPTDRLNPNLVRLALRYRYKKVKKKLCQVADLDNVLGYKGNYVIFGTTKRNTLHSYMMRSFIDDQTGELKDADRLSPYTSQELIEYLKCLRKNNPQRYESEKTEVIEVINKRRSEPFHEKERIIIPTNSVYIEALPGKHPILEDYKLAQRALNVKKLQADVRNGELENIRLALRALGNQLEDPNIENQLSVVHQNSSENQQLSQ